ncbi:hypothetical protein BU23DRAFT_581062 [Bimuria novae-zelandiae CBS 107.79]|uniref:Uncharacterized protein n=1 Tax=Bimuria novae-zelandiae CBS 107.79 TaxID=1447943 RepID=A0A6A5V5E4_9PLEO|nr:hypothetical protein BU23DRAFT_581062 [Bimuria novae-zelandiae CBS 107.79]
MQTSTYRGILIAVKAINNIAGPNSLVLTLLVFGAYLRITIELPLSPLIVIDALNTCNRPNTADMLALPLQSEVLELDMFTSTYDLCLLVINSNIDNFSIVSMQTNNTLMLRIAIFLAHEEKMLKKV